MWAERIIKGTISFGSYLMNPLQLYLLHKECVALLAHTMVYSDSKCFRFTGGRLFHNKLSIWRNNYLIWGHACIAWSQPSVVWVYLELEGTIWGYILLVLSFLRALLVLYVFRNEAMYKDCSICQKLKKLS